MTHDDLDLYHSEGKPIVCRFDDHQISLLKKQFGSGSIGWYGNGKIKLLVGTRYIPVQVSMILTIIGSKDFASLNGPKQGHKEPNSVQDDPPPPWVESRTQGPILDQERPSDSLATDSENHEVPKRVKRKSRR